MYQFIMTLIELYPLSVKMLWLHNVPQPCIRLVMLKRKSVAEEGLPNNAV